MARLVAPPRRALAVALALALMVSTLSPPIVVSALGPPVVGDTSACESCLVFGHILYDAVGDPYVESKLSEYLIASICPNFDDKQSCEANVNNLVEALVAWMRANLEPEDLCHQAGLCATARDAPPGPPALGDLLRALASASSPALPPNDNPTKTNGPKDVTCPLCMFVLTKIKDALSDPITREKVHDAGLQACASLPGGDAAKAIRDDCVDFVERNEAEIYDFIDQSEPSDLCEKLEACTAPTLPTAAERPPGGRTATRLFLSGFPPAATTGAVHLQKPLERLTDGNCDACLAVVKDIHRAIASPEVQDQATALAKQACDALPSSSTGGAADLAGQCKAGVDQYAPLVFGMALAYLQPATLCAQVHLCPAPSPTSSAGEFAALLQAARGSWELLPAAGQGAAAAAAAGAERAVVDAVKAMVAGMKAEERRLERMFGVGEEEEKEEVKEETIAVAAS